ncbi:hypothetical protein [Endozoicomonas numazuensis]|uniref:Uncharacterized protein n=1 Tax=Endozoicomonas numazuensis TaxID=1137799 RepID=A0A081N106_9GAMM|nr:hypothetical protein [Endozoicomonas numazuensis]KEQ12129.1 hypothetical protein GZ78_28255 [Endozoicomonas numazuensis]
MAGILETGQSIARGTLNGAVRGALLPAELSYKAGKAVGLAFGKSVAAVVGLPGYLVIKGVNVFRPQNKKFDASEAFNIVPVAPFKYIGAGLALTSTSPALIALTPLAAIGGTVFGAVFTVTRQGGKKLVGLIAYRQQGEAANVQQIRQQLMDLQRRIVEKQGDANPADLEDLVREFNHMGNDDQILIMEHVQGLTNAAGEPIPVTDENIVEILNIIHEISPEGDLAPVFMDRLMRLIKNLGIEDGDELCDGLNAYKSFLQLQTVQHNQGAEVFTGNDFKGLVESGALNNPVVFQAPVHTIEEMTQEQIEHFGTLDAYLNFERERYLTRRLNTAMQALQEYQQGQGLAP